MSSETKDHPTDHQSELDFPVEISLACNITIGDTYIMIEAKPGHEPSVKQVGTMSANEHAALSAIVQLMRCLSKGQCIGPLFNPHLETPEMNRMVKCMWKRSGILSFYGDCNQQFMHANTHEEAMLRSRNFTCPYKVYLSLPRRRSSK